MAKGLAKGCPEIEWTSFEHGFCGRGGCCLRSGALASLSRGLLVAFGLFTACLCRLARLSGLSGGGCLGCERDGSRSGEGGGEKGEDCQVGVELDAVEAADAKRREAVVVF